LKDSGSDPYLSCCDSVTTSSRLNWPKMIASPVMTLSIDGAETTVLSSTIATRRSFLSALPSP
jgi:hypothetical protein